MALPLSLSLSHFVHRDCLRVRAAAGWRIFSERKFSLHLSSQSSVNKKQHTLFFFFKAHIGINSSARDTSLLPSDLRLINISETDPLSAFFPAAALSVRISKRTPVLSSAWRAEVASTDTLWLPGVTDQSHITRSALPHAFLTFLCMRCD